MDTKYAIYHSGDEFRLMVGLSPMQLGKLAHSMALGVVAQLGDDGIRGYDPIWLGIIRARFDDDTTAGLYTQADFLFAVAKAYDELGPQSAIFADGLKQRSVVALALKGIQEWKQFVGQFDRYENAHRKVTDFEKFDWTAHNDALEA